jgi:AcrR family transcriptional regulator
LSPALRQPAKELGPRASRTIAAILAATKQIFQARGYAGTTIDEITRVAGVSRASFYTYFPSKRDVLLALGANSATEAELVAGELRRITHPWSLEDMEEWVKKFFALLDEHGSFALAWTQAAPEDEEIRVAGLRRHLEVCRRLGAGFDHLRGESLGDPTQQGLLAFSLLERGWWYGRLYAGAIDEGELQVNAALIFQAMLRPSSRALGS